MTCETLRGQETGWAYTEAGTPVAFIQPRNRPAEAMVIPFPSWWEALRFSVTFAHYNHCEYVGGPRV